MNTEKVVARIETVRRKIQRWQRAAERRRVDDGPPSKGYVEACMKAQRYKSELVHLEELLSGRSDAR